ncbi:thiol-activated cytolysin family protein [Sediminicola sp. YIK13]|uniref:thiol-activated cytolysin family protein n=1 Tax=Sediminicola sp. YIK13 TaxID=1453352 RepID=UPI0007808990|nr:thiol-activated cytolysin family protein [Sediminicola sp. YIK13]
MRTITTILTKVTPNWQVRPVLLLILLLSLLFITACSKDEAGTKDPIAEDPESELTFAQVVAVGGEFEVFPKSRTTESVATSTPVNVDYERVEEGGEEITERSVCVTKTVSALDGNGQFPLFNSNADVIFPGNLLQGKTLSDATPKPIVVGRAGGTISYNLNNGNLSSTFTVDEVKKSTIQNGMNNIIASAGDVVPANFQVDIVQIESESQMALEMGIEVETFTTKVEGNMSFSTEKEYNRTLVKVNQSYYTMSFDLPTSLDQIFGENVTPEQLETYIQADNPATFISSVTYGRIFYMLIESTSSREEMQASLKVTYDAAAINGSGSLDVETFNSLKEVKIKAIAYGGDAEGSFQLLGETSIAAIANKIGAGTDIRAGLPLSYVVRSVERPDQVVGTKLATEYDIVTCEVKGILPPDVYRPLVDLFEDGIGAAFQLSGTSIVVYNKAGNKYAYYDIGSGSTPIVWDVENAEGLITSNFISTGNVGAAIRWRSDIIYLFNMDGTQFKKFRYNPSNFPLTSQNNGPIGTIEETSNEVPRIFSTSQEYAEDLRLLPGSSFPFANDGIDAAIQTFNDGKDLATHIYFANDGKSSAVLLDATPVELESIFGYTWQWFAPKLTSDFLDGKSFNSIGAATKVDFGGDTQDEIYFNGEGSQMIIYNDNGVSGPFFIN